MIHLLDTNICIALLKNLDHALIAKLQERSPNDFALCSVVKAELLYGARKSQQVERNLELLSKFFSQFNSFDFDDIAADFYGTTRVLLERAGAPIGNSDLLIASIALSKNAVVVTRNRKEFIRVPGLKIETW